MSVDPVRDFWCLSLQDIVEHWGLGKDIEVILSSRNPEKGVPNPCIKRCHCLQNDTFCSFSVPIKRFAMHLDSFSRSSAYSRCFQSSQENLASRLLQKPLQVHLSRSPEVLCGVDRFDCSAKPHQGLKNG